MDNLPFHSDTMGLPPNPSQNHWAIYKRRLFLAVGLVAFLIVLANFVGTTLGVLLLLFLCVLIALGLRAISDRVAKYPPFSDKLLVH